MPRMISRGQTAPARSFAPPSIRPARELPPLRRRSPTLPNRSPAWRPGGPRPPGNPPNLTPQGIQALARRLPLKAFIRRLNPWVNAVLTAKDLYDLWSSMRETRERIPNGWQVILRCNPPGSYLGRNFQSSSTCYSGNVFPGQSGLFSNATFPTINQTFWENTYQRPHPTQPALYEGRVFGLARYGRVSPASVPLPAPTTVPSIGFQLNPNIQRRLPSPLEIPMPYRAPSARERQRQRDALRREAGLETYPQMVNRLGLSILAQLGIDPAQEKKLKEFTWTNYDIPARQHARQRTRYRERKAMSKIKQLGMFLYRVLDKVSEGAEIVDAVYEALPEMTKKRWDRDDRKMIDSFGQYGLSGADWKLQALYYNWHLVDLELAVTNIIRNEIQDQIIGRVQKHLPKNTGSAFTQGEIFMAQLIDDVTQNVLDRLKGDNDE